MARSWTASRTGSGIRVWELAHDATLRLPPGRNGILARVERGTVLVTQAGDPEDHVLGPGDEVRFPPGGLAVAWALTPSVLAVRDAIVPKADRPERAEARMGVAGRGSLERVEGSPRPGNVIRERVGADRRVECGS